VKRKYSGFAFTYVVGKSRLTKCTIVRRNFLELIRTVFAVRVNELGSYKVVHRERTPINMSFIERKSIEQKMSHVKKKSCFAIINVAS